MKEFKEILNINEAKISQEQFQKEVKEIAKMTDRNYHSDAKIAGAELLIKIVGKKYIRFLKIFNAISDIKDIEREMPGDLSKYNYRIFKEMMNMSKKDLSKEDADILNMSF